MAPVLTVTFVRHGESTDNLREVWAGWKDSPLSNHGMNQARALGASFANVHFTAIYASDLKRAYTTAEAIRDAQSGPKPPLVPSESLREQHFGIAEGHPWLLAKKPNLTLEEHYAQKIFPVLLHRSEKFPEGESLDDLARRAEQAVQELILPHIWDTVREGFKGGHIAVVSHGLCISEMVPALLREDARGLVLGNTYRGLLNTAWTRVAIDIQGWNDGIPPQFPDDTLPPLNIKVTDFNRHEHLDNVKRQKGGIGRAAYDPKQQDIRAFFGGAATKPEIPEGRSTSNVLDETHVEIE